MSEVFLRSRKTVPIIWSISKLCINCLIKVIRAVWHECTSLKPEPHVENDTWTNIRKDEIKLFFQRLFEKKWNSPPLWSGVTIEIISFTCNTQYCFFCFQLSPFEKKISFSFLHFYIHSKSQPYDDSASHKSCWFDILTSVQYIILKSPSNTRFQLR